MQRKVIISRQVSDILARSSDIPGLNVYCYDDSDDSWPEFDMNLVKTNKPFDLYVDFTGPV